MSDSVLDDVSDDIPGDVFNDMFGDVPGDVVGEEFMLVTNKCLYNEYNSCLYVYSCCSNTSMRLFNSSFSVSLSMIDFTQLHTFGIVYNT